MWSKVSTLPTTPGEKLVHRGTPVFCLVSLMVHRYPHILQASVVQNVDIAIHWINLYPVGNPIGFPNTYPLDSNLSSG